MVALCALEHISEFLRKAHAAVGCDAVDGHVGAGALAHLDVVQHEIVSTGCGAGVEDAEDYGARGWSEASGEGGPAILGAWGGGGNADCRRGGWSRFRFA